MEAYDTLRDTLGLTPNERSPLLADIASSVEASYITLRDTPDLTPAERAPLLAKVATSSWHSYDTLHTSPDLTPDARETLLAKVATSVLYSYDTLRYVTDLTPEQRAPLLVQVVTSAEYSRHTLSYVKDLTPEERASLYAVVQPTPITQEQATLMRRTMDKINNDPTCWDQSDWHCGTSHCFAGHVEGEVHGEWERDDLTYGRAREALGLSKDMADVLFQSNTTLEQLNEYVDHLTNGAE